MELRELPSDEGIVEGVFSSSDESSSPISGQTKVNEVLLSLGREEVEPVKRVLELGDLSLINAELEEDLVLSAASFLVSSSAVLDLAGETHGRSLDGHSSAMETEGEEHVLALLPLVADLVFTLRNGVSVAYKGNTIINTRDNK